MKYKQNTNEIWYNITNIITAKMSKLLIRSHLICRLLDKSLVIYSLELRLSPRVVRSVPNANETKFGSDSAALMNVKRPTIPN